MIRSPRLNGRSIAVLAADGFESIELVVPVDALRAAGARVEIVSLRAGRIRGVNLHEPAARVRVDRLVESANPADYDGLLIPGGFINPDLLRQSAAARSFVREFDVRRKPIATLCHGPWVLVSAGLTQGRTMTAWPGIRDDVVNSGAVWLDEPLVRDGNWLTSRGPQDLAAFVRGILALFGGAPAPAAQHDSATSAPPRVTPPALMVAAMKWVPRPSLRTAALIAMLAVAWIASRDRS